MISVLMGSNEVKADVENPTKVETFANQTYKESLKEYAPKLYLHAYEIGFDKKGKAKISWRIDAYQNPQNSKITYQLQIADNAKFKKAKSFTSSKEYYNVTKSTFGKNGGTFYLRVRFCESGSGKNVYSSWSEVETLNFVKINKTNFPGLYKLLKWGYQTYEGGFAKENLVKKVYDVNKDGWLDPKEIHQM